MSKDRCSRAALLAALGVAFGPASSAHAATCADYPNQAAAQQAADTRDADGDGIYWESLPCPCSTRPAGNPSRPRRPTRAPRWPTGRSCVKPKRTQLVTFSRKRYPNIRAHYLDAVREGWPRFLVINRPGADARRDRLLVDWPTREGYDRDEYPPAVARGRGFHIRGENPRGWMASVQYVPSGENRSHGSSLGAQLRRFCNGTMFRYVFR